MIGSFLSAGPNPQLPKFMFEQIDGMLKSGLIEPTTCAKYKSEANLILRFIDDVTVHKVTADMVRKMDQDMLAKGYARVTVARAHNALKRHLYEALEKGLIMHGPPPGDRRGFPRLTRREDTTCRPR